jgi:hypothetical protein
MLLGDVREHKASAPWRSLTSEDLHRLSQITRTEEFDDLAASSRKPRLGALGTTRLRRLRHSAQDAGPPTHLVVDLIAHVGDELLRFIGLAALGAQSLVVQRAEVERAQMLAPPDGDQIGR